MRTHLLIMSNHDLIFQLAKMLAFHYFFRIFYGIHATFLKKSLFEALKTISYFMQNTIASKPSLYCYITLSSTHIS